MPSNKAKYNWSPQKYIDLVENGPSPLIQAYEKKEIEYVTSGVNRTKTVIDVGAGYGRVIPHLAPLAKNFIGIEIDSNMFDELRRRAKQYSNVIAIPGDARNLSQLLNSKDVSSPVLLSLQNSFGTWEGDYKKNLKEMIKIAKNNGEIIISLFTQEGLRNYGIDMYHSISKLVGEPDLKRTDFKKGIFRSKTGYLSKWWTKKEREEYKKLLGGKIVKEILYPAFYILHLSYK